MSKRIEVINTEIKYGRQAVLYIQNGVIEFDTADLEYGKGILSIETMEEAIKKSKITKNELIKQLKKMHLDSPDSILLATITDKDLQFYFKDVEPKNYSLLE